MVLSPGIVSQNCLSASNMSQYLVFTLRGAAISLYVLSLQLIYNVYSFFTSAYSQCTDHFLPFRNTAFDHSLLQVYLSLVARTVVVLGLFPKILRGDRDLQMLLGYSMNAG